MMGMKTVFIIPTKKEALERFHSPTDPRDVWAVWTQSEIEKRKKSWTEGNPIWVETGAVTRTATARATAEKKAKAAVQLQTGEQVERVDYDP